MNAISNHGTLFMYRYYSNGHSYYQRHSTGHNNYIIFNAMYKIIWHLPCKVHFSNTTTTNNKTIQLTCTAELPRAPTESAMPFLPCSITCMAQTACHTSTRSDATTFLFLQALSSLLSCHGPSHFDQPPQNESLLQIDK